MAYAAPRQATTIDAAARWQQQVAAIGAGNDTAARGDAIKSRLSSLGLNPREKAFITGEHKGSNLLADIGGPTSAPLLLIGAHYDRVGVGRGATANASGSAAVPELTEAFESRPLRNHRVAVAFWDLEEHGLPGSGAYVTDASSQKPPLYVNLDVFGWGDPLKDAAIRPALAGCGNHRNRKGQCLPLSAGETYPPTDHLPFLKAGWPAVSFSLTDRADIDGVMKAYAILEADPKARPPMPRVMEVIHSDRDTVEELDPTNIPAALRTIEAALRAWDAANPGHPSS